MSLYSPLVHHWCRQWGIAEHEVADVTQEVFAAVASSLGQFRPDQPGTTFRGWMRGITRHKLLHHARDRGEPAVGGTDAQVQLQQVPAPADEVELSESPAEVPGYTSGPCAWSSTRSRTGPGRRSGRRPSSPARRRKSPRSWGSRPMPSAWPSRTSPPPPRGDGRS